jgi:uncharacterized protein YjbJ (UPF0337 family)
MDKDRVKGKVEDIGGRIERQVGEWTGDEKSQAEGLKHQVKGKARNAVGKVKDAGRDAMDDLKKRDERNRDIDREKGAA